MDRGFGPTFAFLRSTAALLALASAGSLCAGELYEQEVDDQSPKGNVGVSTCVTPPGALNLRRLDSLLDPKGEIFDRPSDDFIAGEGCKFFKWLDSNRDEAHYPGSSRSPKISFLGRQVAESNIRFSNGTLRDIYISFYNRGDLGELDQDTFERRVGEIDVKISDWAGEKGVQLRKSNLTSEAHIQAKAWVKAPYALTMRWSSSGLGKKDFRAEYIQLEIERFDPKSDPRRQTAAFENPRDSMQSAKSILDNVRADDNGDVSIQDIPMVDQGRKGYCVAASAARVLRYYGTDVTQHDIAQIACTDAVGGTSIKDMFDAVMRVGTKYGVKIRELYKGFQIHTALDMDRVVTKYNALAKKARKTPIAVVSCGGAPSPSDTFEQMDPELFRKLRLEERDDMKKFLKDVKECVDKGMPLLWSVRLGVVEEEKLTPQSKGYHMRLIIGYNEKSREIIYSDSWGASHTFKKMTYDNAWCISQQMLVMEPRKQ
jgi:uncharacterized protein YvpB